MTQEVARCRRQGSRQEIVSLLCVTEEMVSLTEEMVSLAEEMVSLAETMISLEASVLPGLTVSPAK